MEPSKVLCNKTAVLPSLHTSPRYAGALLSGGVHYLNTAKKLNEEGVDAVARIKAVPIAVRLALPDHWQQID